MIGDVLTSSIICENLKRNFPDAEVHYLINRFTIPVVEGNPYIDKFIIFEDEFKRGKLRFYNFLKQISKSNYTHVFDAYGKLESLLITKFSRAKFKFGFRKTYSKFYYTKTVKISDVVKTEAGSAIENRLRLLNLMPDVKIFRNKPKIYITEQENQNAKMQFEAINVKPKNCIMVSALGSNTDKTYPLEYLAKILNYTVEKTDKNLILNYMPSQQKYIDRLLHYCNTQTKLKIITDIEMKSLRSFMCICNQCTAVIGNEGGAINMAKALDVPSFSIFSPWILKKAWNSFEKSYNNQSVHLSDFQPNMYKQKHPKSFKKESEELYKKLKPELFFDRLSIFFERLNV